MTRLQDNRHDWITGVMRRLGLPFQRRDINLTRQDVAAALLTLRERIRADGRCWSVIDEKIIALRFVDTPCSALNW